MSIEAKKSGLATEKVKITNHSRVEENTMVKITGHAKPKSIKPYLQLDDEHHANLVEKMGQIGSFNFNSNSASLTLASSGTAMESKHNNFYNCVFHCNSSCNF